MPDQRKEWYTVKDAATYLNVSERTMWRYINESLVQFSNVNPLGKRRKILIEAHILMGFVASHKTALPSVERPKRVYNRDVKKYARKKKPMRRKTA